VTLGLALMKADGTPVKAEFLRPRDWVERLGLSVGGLLPVGVSELNIDCEAVVTSITPCPEIAEGEGRVVTGRFVTRDAGNLVTVALDNGTEIRATDVHPVWSVDREDWVPAGDLEPGELVDTLAGPVAVLSVERLESALDVYNIEVHGEHVFRVTADGVLVHNAGPDDCGLVIRNLPLQLHHYATNKNSAYTPAMEAIANRFKLSLDGLWNKERLLHLGRHPNEYHDFVLRGMKRAAREAKGSSQKFLELFEKYIKEPIRINPELLRKSGWE
jgi:hypothetical protein